MSSIVQQKITVHLAAPEGAQLEVVSANPDLVRWDITRAKHKWPSMEEAPMLWATFVAWAAAKRLKLYAGTWEDWSNTDAISVDFDMEGQEDVDPTQTAPAPSSQ